MQCQSHFCTLLSPSQWVSWRCGEEQTPWQLSCSFWIHQLSCSISGAVTWQCHSPGYCSIPLILLTRDLGYCGRNVAVKNLLNVFQSKSCIRRWSFAPNSLSYFPLCFFLSIQQFVCNLHVQLQKHFLHLLTAFFFFFLNHSTFRYTSTATCSHLLWPIGHTAAFIFIFKWWQLKELLKYSNGYCQLLFTNKINFKIYQPFFVPRVSLLSDPEMHQSTARCCKHPINGRWVL